MKIQEQTNMVSRFSRLAILIPVLLFVLVAGGCTDDPGSSEHPVPEPVTAVTVAPKAASLIIGQTLQLTATVSPDNATNQNVTWSSNNEAVATVTGDGLVSAISEGEATITVTTEDGNKTDACVITITTEPVLVSGVTVAPKTASIVIGGTQQLTATVAPDNSTNKKVEWSSNNEAVATVTGDGLVSAISEGEATITVTTEDGGKTDYCVITITTEPVLVSGVTVAPKTASIVIGGTQQLTATVAPENATNKKVEWSSSNTSIATVNSSGLVTGVSAGTATITVTTEDGGKTDNCVITITTEPVLVTGVTITPKTASIVIGGTQQLTATVAPENATNKNVEWSSSNTSVATVNSSGLVSGVSAGTATITVTTEDGNKTDTCVITITTEPVLVTGVTIAPKFPSVVIGGTQQLTATVAPENATNKNVTWNSSNTSVATVNSSGLVTGVSAGTATITVTTAGGEFSDTCSVIVSERGQAPLMSVEIENFKLTAWDKQQWQSQGNRPDGEIHPLLPLEFEVVLNSDRSSLSMEDQVWIAVYLMENSAAPAMSRPFSTQMDEPTDDPLYLGFYPFDPEGGKQTVTFRMHPETGVRPGQYRGFRAEFFVPGDDAELLGTTQYEWLENVTVLNLNSLPSINQALSELTIQADSPVSAGTPGFDFGPDAIVDPLSGFSRLFGADTPYSRSDAGGAVTGYYAEISISLEIMALSGTVSAIEFKEDNGLSFWNPTAGRFENTYLWEGQHISNVRYNPDIGENEAVYSQGFPRGTNGTSLVVGYAGNTPPAIKISDIKLTLTAVNGGGSAQMTSSIFALSDETLRPRAYAAAGFTVYAADDIPLILPENPRRVDLPVKTENRKMDFSKNSFEWDEKLEDTDLWKRSMGPRADYIGSGKRTLYGSEEGEKDKFAARAYAFFEEYTGLVHRLPAPGRMSIHDLASICGTRTGVGVDIWIVDNKFTIFNAGAEFRNELTAKTASEKNAAGEYLLISDPVEVANYAQFSGMESEFNAEVVALGTTLLSLPLYCNNAQPLDTKYSNLRLFEHANEVAVQAQFYILAVRAGARFTFYVDLRLSNQFQNITNGVSGKGSIALVPGVQVHGFAEAGVDIVFASVYLGLRLLFVELAVVPEYIMEGQISWRNDSGKGMPVVTSNWSSYPKLGLEIGTLDGEIYVRGKVLFISYEEVFFRWKGFRWYLELWKGKPSDRPALTLPLRRYGEDS